MGQEAMLAKHSTALDHDHGDVLLAADGCDPPLALLLIVQLGHYSGAWVVRGHGVAHAHGHPLLPGRQHRSRVHHLGAKGGQLRRLLEGQNPDRLRRCDDPGIRGLHPAHVLPDLDLGGLDRGADHRGREIRAVAAQGGDDPFGVLRYVASDDWYMGVMQLERAQLVADFRGRILEDLHRGKGGVRRSGAAGGLHADVPGIDSSSLHLLGTFSKAVVRSSKCAYTQPLAEGHDAIPRLRRYFLEQSDSIEEFL
mmetsp:Transcript_95238/g.226800  ORF Transcript_95238/g.226800 Transcript_95238/m.226800 type:complete len:253 (-) Transcript_95238:570-1328(-)